MKKKFKVKKGDTVVVIAGKDKGKSGNITSMLTDKDRVIVCLLYTSPSPRDRTRSRMPSSA